MTTTPKRTQRDYSFAFKLAVVDQVEKGELTYKQAQSKYGIQGRINCFNLASKAWSTKLGARCFTFASKRRSYE